jgi:predicted molibdopterin-dependent oxidoreductase YjgC
MLAVELADRLGGDLRLESVQAITDEIAAVAPAYAGITSAALAATAGFDGILAGVAPATAVTVTPVVAQSEAPEIHAAAAQGETHSATNEATVEETTVDEVDDDAPAARPPVLRHTPVVTSHDVPAVDAYSLRLVATHKLYDDGTLTQQAPSLAPLAGGTAIHVNPTDLDRLGLTHGDAVKVTSSRTSLTLAAEADTAVPKGVALVVFDQAGPGAADLLDSTSPVTDVRVETL